MTQNANENTPLLHGKRKNKDGQDVEILPEIDGKIVSGEMSNCQIEEGQQSSFVTIFSFWNMLMGTSLLSIPWAFQQAGLTQAFLVIFLMSLLAFYTASIILKASQELADPVTKQMPEFIEICRKLIGRWAAWANTIASIVVMGGALIVYWILLVELLYDSVNSINYFAQHHNRTRNTSTFIDINGNNGHHVTKPLPIPGWSERKIVPLVFIPLFLPILQLRNISFFSRLGAFGTGAIMFLICGAITKGVIWGWNCDFVDQDSVHYVPQFLGSFPALTGLLGMGFFIHNSITTIFKHNKKQENNMRDMKIGYALVLSTYLTIGLSIYLTFPEEKINIKQNFLDNLPWNDAFSLALQLVYFLRMLTVFPIVSYILRVQFFSVLTGQEYPGKFSVAIFSLVIVTLCVVCAIFFPNVGDIIRYAGAFCAMILMFLLPSALHIQMIKRRGTPTVCQYMVCVVISLLGITNFVAQFTLPI